MTVTDAGEASDPGQTHSDTFQAATELPSVALIEAVAAAKDADPVDLDPFGRHFDMDALDALLQSSPAERTVAVTVEFQGVRAEIDSEGTVTVRRTDSEAPDADL